MAKGDDALRRKRNKANRKRLRNSESSVSARVASIIAAKFRRKAGKRRICEGMCFSLPTADDPFNDRHEKKSIEKNKKSKKQKLNRRENGQKESDSAKDADNKLQEEKALMKKTVEKTGCNGEAGCFENGSVSKFLMLCLKAVEDAWVEEGTLNKDMIGALQTSSWGAEFFRVCLAGSSVVVISGASATRDQVSWLVSTAADMVTRKKKQGIIVASPFLLYIVPSRDRAFEVRAVCKPLKALGIHTVSLHFGTSLGHQVHGLKNCEPEFIVSTPERLLELVSLKAVDISGTSLLVVDGLRKFVDLDLPDNLKSIRDRISGDSQIITFSDGLGEMPVTVLLQHLIRGAVYRLFEDESVASTSNFVSQYIHLYSSEEEKLSEILQILAQALSNQTTSSKVLLISGCASKINPLSSYLNSKGYTICVDGHSRILHKTNGEKSGTVLIKDLNDLHDLHMDKLEIVIIVDFPSSIMDYIAVLTKVARHTLVGVLHSFFSTVDAPLAPSLIEVLEQCGQVAPEFLRSL
ncbi:ATP-dependent RNA helicase DBP3 [Phalaenopsis equestris]|uniref:ATP-dependent RNA helicase DBP3 n=1 Tax=Phalaenopsis equestris TaxID=78828 RepID=UPI0009E4830E|nr:ATP-dependent RNA helicase DBP3 [Phalaenopsis equestris]